MSELDEKCVMSCDDEGYETPGKKEHPVPAKPASKHDPVDSASEDDGYETGGKKRVLLKSKSTAGKEGRKLRGGGSPRAEPSSNKTPEELHVEKIIKEMEGLVIKENLTDSALELLRLVPDGYIPLPHQVGGHRHIDGKLGFLRRRGQPHLLYKPVQSGSKGMREVSFYDALYNRKTTLGTPSMFPSLCHKEGTNSIPLSVLPMYHGLTTIADRAGHHYDYIILEDITHRFTHPCIIDLKMGQRVWDDHADSDKIERELKKYPAQETLGFRIIGMRIFKPSFQDYVYYDRYFGRQVTESTASAAVSKFFEVGDGTYRTDILEGVLSRLTEFTDWMEKQNYLSLFATSLLIVYEGGPTPREGEKTGHLDMRLVDFAHTYEKENIDSPDANALFGVRNYMKYLNELKMKLSSK